MKPLAPLLLFNSWSLSLSLSANRAHAMDKQGSAHRGQVEGPSTGINVSGAVMVGAAFYNPTYAARPDNSGKALMRYAAHADLDLIGRRLSVPVDLNPFADRVRKGATKPRPVSST